MIGHKNQQDSTMLNGDPFWFKIDTSLKNSITMQWSCIFITTTIPDSRYIERYTEQTMNRDKVRDFLANVRMRKRPTDSHPIFDALYTCRIHSRDLQIVETIFQTIINHRGIPKYRSICVKKLWPLFDNPQQSLDLLYVLGFSVSANHCRLKLESNCRTRLHKSRNGRDPY